jgi:hypothetical protein
VGNATINEREYAIEHAGGGSELMQDKKRCTACIPHLTDDRVHDVDAGGVEVGVWFIKEKQPRAHEHQPGERQPALHPGRKTTHAIVGCAGEADSLERRLKTLRRSTQHLAGEPQILERRQIFVKARRVREETNVPSHVICCPGDVVSIDGRHSGIWLEQRGKNAQKGCLAAPIGTYQSDNLTELDLEGHSAQTPTRAEPARYTMSVYG